MHHILIVDDDADARATLSEMLQDEGHGVLHAASGQEALALLGAGLRPCMLLLRAQLPDAEGPRLLEAMRQHPEVVRRVPVVLYGPASAHTLGPPVAQVLPQPLDAGELLDALRAHCSGR